MDETEEYWVFKNGPRQLADGNNFPKSKVIIKLKKSSKIRKRFLAPKVNFLGRMQRLIKPGTTHQILRERKGKWDRWMKYSKATHQTPSQRKGKMNEVRRVKPGHLEP